METTIKIKVKAGRDRRSQAAMTVFLCRLAGEELPEVCAVCGGVAGDVGALHGRCRCPRETNIQTNKQGDV